MPCPGKTKTIKPIINEAFVASSRDIVVDYNDFYSRCITPQKHYHVCICERRSDKQALHYTAHNSHLNNRANSLNMKTYLQAASHKRQTVLAKLELPHFLETAFVLSWYCRLLSQLQEIVIRKMHNKMPNIGVELFWNSVVNTTYPLISSCVLFWKYFNFHNETQHLQHMAPAAATILQRE